MRPGLRHHKEIRCPKCSSTKVTDLVDKKTNLTNRYCVSCGHDFANGNFTNLLAVAMDTYENPTKVQMALSRATPE